MQLNASCKSAELTCQADKLICSNAVTNYPEFIRTLAFWYCFVIIHLFIRKIRVLKIRSRWPLWSYMKLEWFLSSKKLWKCILTTPTTPGKPNGYSNWQVPWAKKRSDLPDGPQDRFAQHRTELRQTSHGAPPGSVWGCEGRAAGILKPPRLGPAAALRRL